MTTLDTEKPQVRAGCYCRISSDPKDKRHGVNRQKDDTTTLCAVKGWTPTEFYIDNDRSASSGKERPEWDRLLEDVAAGRIDAIAAWDQDRGWRMMHELEDLRKFFTGLGRRVPLATTGQGDIDLYSPTGVLAAQIKTAVSEHEIAMMRVRQRRAARDRAERGVPRWKHAFGYIATPQGPVPDPVLAQLVRDAYAAIRAGASLREVAAMFNDAGAYGRTGSPWTEGTVSHFIRKPRNAGIRTHTDTETGVTVVVGKGTWEPLVDEGLWRAAQASLDARPGGGQGRRRSMRQHLLSGLLWCGKDGCDGYLNGRHVGGTGSPITYTCTLCHGVSVRAEVMEPFVVGLVGGRLAMPDAVDLLKAEVHDADEARRLRDEKAALYGRMDALAVERAQGLLTARQVQVASEVIQQQIAELEGREQDAERLRVFDAIPLGTKGAVGAVGALSPDRFRAVLSVLMRVTIAPVGKGSHVFNPDRVLVEWL